MFVEFKTKRPSNVVCDLYSSGKCKPTIHFVILDKTFTYHSNDSACNFTMTSLNYLSPEQKKRKQNRYFTFEEHFCPIHFSIIWIAVILSPLFHRLNIQLCKKCLQCAHFYDIAGNCFQFFFSIFSALIISYYSSGSKKNFDICNRCCVSHSE